MSTTLRREVAEAVGYRLRWVSEDRGYELLLPDGGTIRGITPMFDADYMFDNTPDYPNDIRACIRALDATGAQWTLRNHHDLLFNKVYQCEINVFGEEAETLPLAICKALLAYYRDATDGGRGIIVLDDSDDDDEPS